MALHGALPAIACFPVWYGKMKRAQRVGRDELLRFADGKPRGLRLNGFGGEQQCPRGGGLPEPQAQPTVQRKHVRMNTIIDVRGSKAAAERRDEHVSRGK